MNKKQCEFCHRQRFLTCFELDRGQPDGRCIYCNLCNSVEKRLKSDPDSPLLTELLPDKLYSVKELAELWKYSLPTVYKKVREFHLDGKLRFSQKKYCLAGAVEEVSKEEADKEETSKEEVSKVSEVENIDELANFAALLKG